MGAGVGRSERVGAATLRAPWTGAPYRLDPADVARLPSPALLVYLDALRANLDRMLELLGGDADRWRPHLKTTKSPRLWRELTQRGLRRFKCATVDEAEALLALARAEGVEVDLFVAYPHHGPAVERLARLAAEHPQARVSVPVESLDDLERWPRSMGVFLELDPGMHRTGLSASARARVLELARAAGERLVGVHAYEGHLTEPDPRRETHARAVYRDLVELVGELERRGVRVGEVLTSGTPALAAALAFEGFEALAGARHRVSPGTLVLHDARSEEQNPGLGFRPAALVLTRVVSRPHHGRATCDAGSKAVSAEAGGPAACVLDWPRLVPATPSEEHLPLDAEPGAADELPPRGAALLLVPRHVCTTVNLYDEAVLVEGGRVVGRAAIAARGHRLWGVS